MSYIKMSNILVPKKVEEVEIDIMDYTNKELGFWEKMSGLQQEKYARLKINGETMMSETPMEERTNSFFTNHAHGDILIGGLGIGMIILAIQNNPDVNSITVIEKNPHVIEAVLPQLPINKKVTVIEADVFSYKPTQKFDCIYMDIWAYVNSDVYKEMKQLKRKYGHYLKSLEESPRRFNECWAEYYAKTGSRLY